MYRELIYSIQRHALFLGLLVSVAMAALAIAAWYENRVPELVRTVSLKRPYAIPEGLKIDEFFPKRMRKGDSSIASLSLQYGNRSRSGLEAPRATLYGPGLGIVALPHRPLAPQLFYDSWRWIVTAEQDGRRDAVVYLELDDSSHKSQYVAMTLVNRIDVYSPWLTFQSLYRLLALGASVVLSILYMRFGLNRSRKKQLN